MAGRDPFPTARPSRGEPEAVLSDHHPDARVPNTSSNYLARGGVTPDALESVSPYRRREVSKWYADRNEGGTMGRRTQQISAALPAIIVALVIFTGGSPLAAVFYAFLGALVAGIFVSLSSRRTDAGSGVRDSESRRAGPG